nr:MAG TPA: hypothetical protein [Caudoviricetes sp.]
MWGKDLERPDCNLKKHKFKPQGICFRGAFCVILYQIRNNKNILVSHTLVTILKF